MSRSPDPVWEKQGNREDVVSLGFQEIIDDEEEHTQTMSSQSTPVVDSEDAGLSAMGERMARVERAAQSMGAGRAKGSA